MSNVELLSKISVATVFGKVKKPEAPVGLVRVIGIANGVKTGQSQYGDWTAFTGDFKAFNLENGKEFRAGKVFLPAIAQNLIEGALANADAESVQFAFDIGIKPADTQAGYEYTVTPLVEARDNDPLAALEEKVGKLPALEDKSETKSKK